MAISPQDSDEARQKGEALMKQTCRGKGFEVVEEGEAVVGSHTRGDAETTSNKKYNLLLGKKQRTLDTQTSSETRDVTEWRLKFNCKSRNGS